MATSGVNEESVNGSKPATRTTTQSEGRLKDGGAAEEERKHTLDVPPRPIWNKSDYDSISVDARGAIRILKVHSGQRDQQEVRCELVKGTILRNQDRLPTDTDSVPFVPYDALSWCWGKAQANACISIVKNEISHVMYVAPGLAEALRALRHGTHTRYLWVDAICINQGYTPEKNVQVEMMSEVYGRADCVRIWLGGSDASSDLAIRFVKQEILQLQHFDDLSTSKDSSGKWKALLELMQRPWFSRRWVIQEVTLARRAMIHCGKAKLSWTKFAIAVELFVEVESATHRLSEIMKSDEKYNHVPRWFEYISQLGASLLVDATGKLFRDNDYDQTRQTRVKDQTSNAKNAIDQADYLEIDSEDEELHSAQDRIERYRADEAAQSAGMKGQPLLTLEYLVSSMSIFDVTNTHDSVYALLGIARDTTPTAVGKKLRVTDHTQAALEMFTTKKHYPVDYDAHYIDICKEFIQFCIQQSMKRDPSRALDVICRPWAVEIPVAENEPELPSWLPRLSRASYGMVLGPGIEGPRMGRKNADSLVGLPNVTHRNYNAAETKGLDMRTFGFRKRFYSVAVSASSSSEGGEQATLSEPAVDGGTQRKPLTNGTSPLQEESNGSSTPTNGVNNSTASQTSVASSQVSAALVADPGPKETTKIIASDYKAPSKRNYHLSMFVKGFVLDRIARVETASQTGSIPTAWAGFAGWTSMQGTPPDHFWRTLVADRGSDGQNPPVYYSRACQESFRKGGTDQGTVDTMGLIDNERNSVVSQFCRRVQAAIWNRALIRTCNDRLGLVSQNVREGDLVCILYGCSVPVVLRKSKKKPADVVKQEMEAELRYIADYVVANCRTHLARRKIFRDKRRSDMKQFEEWELGKRKQWEEDKAWSAQWQLVQAALIQIHEFRSWVTKKRSPELATAGKTKEAQDTIEIMRICINIWLLKIYDIAAWAAKVGECGGNETIIDRMQAKSMELGTNKPCSMTQEQSDLWSDFKGDPHWHQLWEQELQRYVDNDGFRAWARERKLEIGYEEVEQEARKEWESDTSKRLERRTINSWFLCIDPFRAWLRQRGKFSGPEKEVDLKQQWETDDDWRRRKMKYATEGDAFNAWMDERGKRSSVSASAMASGEVAEFLVQLDELQAKWRADPDANLDGITKAVDAWKAGFEAERASRAQRRAEVEARRDKERVENLNKEAFLERWRKGWAPGVVNWREFRIALRYVRRWLAIWRDHKQFHLREREDQWNGDHEVLHRQQARRTYMSEPYGVFSNSTHNSFVTTERSNGQAASGQVNSAAQSGGNVSSARTAMSPATQADDRNASVYSNRERGTEAPSNEVHDTTQSDTPTSHANVTISYPGQAETHGESAHDMASEETERSETATAARQHNAMSTPRSPGGTALNSSRVAQTNGKLSPQHGKRNSASAPPAAQKSQALRDKYPAHAHNAKSVPPIPGQGIERRQTTKDFLEADELTRWRTWRDQIYAYYPPDRRWPSKAPLKEMIANKKRYFDAQWNESKNRADAKHMEMKKTTPSILVPKAPKSPAEDRPEHGSQPSDPEKSPEDTPEDDWEELRLDLSRQKHFIPAPDKREKPDERSKRHAEAAKEEAHRAKYPCLHPKGYWSVAKKRAMLSETEAKMFMLEVKENFQKRRGEDAKWHYEMLGEAYIHSMMDGEAMKYQNDEGISSTLFEIR